MTAVYDLLQDLRAAARDLGDLPRRHEQASSLAAALEHAITHGGRPGHPNLSSAAAERNARRFLMQWNVDGFLHERPET